MSVEEVLLKVVGWRLFGGEALPECPEEWRCDRCADAKVPCDGPCSLSADAKLLNDGSGRDFAYKDCGLSADTKQINDGGGRESAYGDCDLSAGARQTVDSLYRLSADVKKPCDCSGQAPTFVDCGLSAGARQTVDGSYCLSADAKRCLSGAEVWEKFFEMASRQRVEAIVWDAFEEAGWTSLMDEGVRVKWGCSVAFVEDGYFRLYSVARKVCGVLRDSGVRYRVLKGVAVASLYPEPSHRRFSDIDIFFPDGARTAEKVLSDAFSAAVEHGLNHHDKMSVEGVEIELHRQLFNTAKHRSNGALHRRMMELYDSEPYTFGLLFLVHHAAQHFVDGEMSLVNLTDIGLYISKFEGKINFPKVSDIAHRFGFDGFYGAVLSILDDMGLCLAAALEGAGTGAGSIDKVTAQRVLRSTLAPERLSSEREGRSLLYKVRLLYANRWKKGLVYRGESFAAVLMRTALFYFRRKLTAAGRG